MIDSSGANFGQILREIALVKMDFSNWQCSGFPLITVKFFIELFITATENTIFCRSEIEIDFSEKYMTRFYAEKGSLYS